MLDIFPLGVGLISIAGAIVIALSLLKKSPGTKKMQEISAAIHRGGHCLSQ